MTSITKWIQGSSDAKPAPDTAQATSKNSDKREYNRISPKAEMKNASLIVPDEDVEIYGRWTGENACIDCHTLTIEKGSYVEGIINAQRIRIFGHLKGEVTTNYLVVQEGANVEGNVQCRSMNVANNSRLRANVQCDNDGSIVPTDIPLLTNNFQAIETKPRLVASKQ